MADVAATRVSQGKASKQRGRSPDPLQQPANSFHDQVLALQRSAGNHAVGQLLQSGNGVLQRKCAFGHSIAGLGTCAQCQQDGSTSLQRRTTSPETPVEVPPIVRQTLNSSGQPLDAETRSYMEDRFGQELSQVRVHTDAQASDSAKAVHAEAYTVGQRIVFSQGLYAPNTTNGRSLLAHEITHVIQQTSGTSGGSQSPASAEAEAEAAAHSLGSFTVANRQVPNLARKPPSPTEKPLTDKELLDILIRKRAFAFSEPGAPAVDPAGVGKGIGPQAGGRKAGDAVFAIIQITNRNGELVERSMGAYFGGGDQHAEEQALHILEKRLLGRDVEGGEMLVVVDQIPCSPERNDCGGKLLNFARKFKLRHRIRIPTRPNVRQPSVPVGPRAAVRGAQRTDFPEVGLTDLSPNSAPTPRPGGAANDNAVPRPGGAANNNAVPRPGGAANDNAVPRPGSAANDNAVPRLGSVANDNAVPRPGSAANDNAVPRPGSAANDNAVPRPGGAANDNAVPRPGGAANDNAVPRPGSGKRFTIRISRSGVVRVGVGLAKFFGPMILDMANRYFMGKAEHERALAMIDKKIEGSDVQQRIADLVDRQRLDLARKQFRGGKTYVTVSLKLTFTNEVLDNLSLSRIIINDKDENSFISTVMSHDPIFGIEGTVWYVSISFPIEQVEVSRSESIQLKLEALEEKIKAPQGQLTPEELDKLIKERDRLREQQKKAEQEEEKAQDEEIRHPRVLPDTQKREQQQSAIREKLRKMGDVSKPASSPSPALVPPSPPTSFLPPPPSPPPSFLPGAPGEGPIQEAARWVKNAELIGQQLQNRGEALVNRLGGANPPTPEERSQFLNEETKWRLALKYMMNWFTERSREEAVQGLKQLLEDPSRPGPKLARINTLLGGV